MGGSSHRPKVSRVALPQLSPAADSCVPDIPCYTIHVRSFVAMAASIRKSMRLGREFDVQHLAAFLALLQRLNCDTILPLLPRYYSQRCEQRRKRCGPGGELWSAMVSDALHNLVLFKQSRMFRIRGGTTMGRPDMEIDAMWADDKPHLRIRLLAELEFPWTFGVAELRRFQHFMPRSHLERLIEPMRNGHELPRLPPGLAIVSGDRQGWHALAKCLFD